MRRTECYRVLGLAGEVSQEELYRAYIARVRQCHPDLNPGSVTARVRFIKVQRAFELLSSDEPDEVDWSLPEEASYSPQKTTWYFTRLHWMGQRRMSQNRTVVETLPGWVTPLLAIGLGVLLMVALPAAYASCASVSPQYDAAEPLLGSLFSGTIVYFMTVAWWLSRSGR